MAKDDLVSLTLECTRCGGERAIAVPRKRGVSPGRYLWECFPCQEKRFGKPGDGITGADGSGRDASGGGAAQRTGREDP